MQLVTLACDINMSETTLEIGSPVDPAECCNGGQLLQVKEDESDGQLARENERLIKETALLKEQLKDANNVNHKLQAELASKQARHSHDVTSLRLQNRKMEEMLLQQRATADKQLGEVIAHLLYIEGKLMREQVQVKSALKAKDDVIRKQKYDIEDLTLKNERLIQAIREHYARKSVNGIATGQNGQTNQENFVPPSPCPSVKHKKGAFSSVKEKLWKHHRSSFDLTEGGQVNMHGNLKEGRQYSSQENLSTLGVRRREARASRDKKCKSIAGYPDHSLERLIPEECELGLESSPWVKHQKDGYYSPDENSYSNGFHDYDHDRLNVSSGNLMSAGSMPVLSERADSPVKERPHSISSIESLSSPKSPKTPDSKCATPSPAPTPTGDSNPFKNLKTILKRKGSKSKKQKRNVSMSQNTTHEYQEAMKKHFEKYEMA